MPIVLCQCFKHTSDDFQKAIDTLDTVLPLMSSIKAGTKAVLLTADQNKGCGDCFNECANASHCGGCLPHIHRMLHESGHFVEEAAPELVNA